MTEQTVKIRKFCPKKYKILTKTIKKQREFSWKCCSVRSKWFWTTTPFFRTDPRLYHKFENMVIFRSGNLYSQDYWKSIPVLSKKFEIDNAKVVFLSELVVIINESWYNQGYIFLIIVLWSQISTFFDEKKNNFSIRLVSWATNWI